MLTQLNATKHAKIHLYVIITCTEIWLKCTIQLNVLTCING